MNSEILLTIDFNCFTSLITRLKFKLKIVETLILCDQLVREAEHYCHRLTELCTPHKLPIQDKISSPSTIAALKLQNRKDCRETHIKVPLVGELAERVTQLRSAVSAIWRPSRELQCSPGGSSVFGRQIAPDRRRF